MALATQMPLNQDFAASFKSSRPSFTLNPGRATVHKTPTLTSTYLQHITHQSSSQLSSMPRSLRCSSATTSSFSIIGKLSIISDCFAHLIHKSSLQEDPTISRTVKHHSGKISDLDMDKIGDDDGDNNDNNNDDDLELISDLEIGASKPPRTPAFKSGSCHNSQAKAPSSKKPKYSKGVPIPAHKP